MSTGLESSARSLARSGQGASAVARRGVEWRRAWRALRALIADPQRTEAVFEITYALGANGGERLFRRFQSHPGGSRLLASRPSLLATLTDRATLAGMPEGSFGRAYAEFMEAAQLTADGLVTASEMPARDRNLDPDRRWLFDRLRDMHDLWHVLTGYGRDEAGEAANLAFTLAQTRDPGIALIVLAAAAIGPMRPTTSPDGRTRGWFHWQRYLYRAWQRGRRAAWLPAVAFEELLPRPLDAVRRSLAIAAAHEAHPDGIVVATRDDPRPTAC